MHAGAVDPVKEREVKKGRSNPYKGDKLVVVKKNDGVKGDHHQTDDRGDHTLCENSGEACVELNAALKLSWKALGEKRDGKRENMTDKLGVKTERKSDEKAVDKTPSHPCDEAGGEQDHHEKPQKIIGPRRKIAL